MSEPKAFFSYIENENKLNMLSDEQAGRLYKALYAYSSRGIEPDFSDDPLLSYAFADFRIDIDRDRERYENTCKRRSEAGKKGGRPKAEEETDTEEKAKKANAFSEKQKKQKVFSKSKKSQPEAEAKAEANNIACAILNNKAHPNFDERAESVLTLYRKICTSFKQPDRLTEHRKRLIYYAEQDKVDFAQLFQKAQASQFLKDCGGIGIDWILKPENRQKIIEGNYDGKNKPPNKRGSIYSLEGASFDLSKLEKGCAVE